MKKEQSKLKKSQKKKAKKMFFRSVAVTFVVCAGVAVAGTALYNNYFYEEGGTKKLLSRDEKLATINKNLAVFGVDDDGYRTDVIFVVNFNSETGKIKVISVPRDTKVNWTRAQQDRLALYSDYDVTTSKINEMTTYGGLDHIRDFTIDELENMLDISIDNYIVVTLDAFRNLVDAVGGVEVDVPALADGSGLHYDDNYQNLHIHLEPGLQTLDGAKAEQLVRFRKTANGTGYAEGDVGRIKTQQLFLDAFAKKLLTPGIVTKIPQMANVIFNSVKTDIKLSEISTYSKYLKKVDSNNLSFNIVPGESAYVGSKWYYVVDEEAMPAFLEQVYHGEDEVEEAVIDYTVSIQVLNSTHIAGAAGNMQAQLEADGYTVDNVGNYGETLSRTIIYAKNIKKAKQFQNYLNHATIIQTDNIGYDVQIVLGNDME